MPFYHEHLDGATQPSRHTPARVAIYEYLSSHYYYVLLRMYYYYSPGLLVAAIYTLHYLPARHLYFVTPYSDVL